MPAKSVRRSGNQGISKVTVFIRTGRLFARFFLSLNRRIMAERDKLVTEHDKLKEMPFDSKSKGPSILNFLELYIMQPSKNAILRY
jgi:hypothetical protein